MNPAGQPGQQASGQPNGQQKPQQRPLQPGDMDKLPLTTEEKIRYKNGLANLYKAMQTAPNGSQQFQEAQSKITQFSAQLMTKIRNARGQGQASTSGGMQGQPGPTATQAGPDQTMAASTSMPTTTAGGQAGSAAATVGAANVQGQQLQPGNRAPAQNIPANVRQHATENVTHAPQHVVDQGPEHVAKYLAMRREAFIIAMMKTQQALHIVRDMDTKIATMQANGAAMNPDTQRTITSLENRRTQARQGHAQAKTQIDTIRQEQAVIKNSRAGNGGASEASANSAGQGGQQVGLNASAAQSGAGEASQAQQAGAAMAGTNSQAAQQNLQGSPGNSAPPAAPQQIKMEPGVSQVQVPPPVNTAIASAAATAGMPSAGTPTQRMPPTPNQTAAPNTYALSHSAALDKANQMKKMNTIPLQGTPQGQGGTPSSAGVMGSTATQPGHSHAHPGANQQPQSSIPSKLPIAKVLPEKAAMAPVPVSTSVGGVAGGRPTYTGGGGTAGGVTGQPILPKIPQVQLEGEGDRVMNRKKLDDLVRQVCGGQSEGQEGNSLTPDVEEAVLTMADSFVDKLLHSACSVAKARGSKVLEIRDIQLVLERTFNIRIPGYATDELRAVRKVQPAVGWLTKISAIQASKVTGNKEF